MSLRVEQWALSSGLPTTMFPITLEERPFDVEQNCQMAVSSSEDPLLDRITSWQQRKASAAIQWRQLLPWFLHCGLLLTSLAFFFAGGMPAKCFPVPWCKYSF
jgi:hypothetical protein